MAIQRDFDYEAGDLTITGAYHKISNIELRYDCGARPSGDEGGGPDQEESDGDISYDVFANSGIRFSIATTLDGSSVKWPLGNWTGVVDADTLLKSAYGYLKTGELVGGVDV
jgi:hypothetical protein